jgi:signal transduction histidine kinase
VDTLFDVARARSGALTLDLGAGALDLAALVREQVAAQQLAVPERRLELHLPERPVPVVGDAVRLGQVMTNYLSNALKYSADDQPVIVRLAVTPEGADYVARVSVEDRGTGLSPEQQTHVWDLYYQVPNVPVHTGASANLESQGAGLGLGLYIVKQLVELHPGGQVGVDSVVGQSSTFWFSLPLADTALSPSP